MSLEGTKANTSTASKSQRSKSRRATNLTIEPGEPDQTSLRSVVREWLAPLMVRQFLVERGIGDPQELYQSNSMNSVFRIAMQGACDKKRVSKSI